MLYHTLCIIPLFITHALAVLVNVTIDDQFGDPSTGQHIAYSPEDAWQVGQTCQACTAKPTPAEDAYLGTWSDASFNPSGNATNDVPGQVIKASVSFTGECPPVDSVSTSIMLTITVEFRSCRLRQCYSYRFGNKSRRKLRLYFLS